MVDVKKLVKYAWENTESKRTADIRHGGRVVEVTRDSPITVGGNVATHEGTTSQVRSWADRKGEHQSSGCNSTHSKTLVAS